jgi:regulator of protease activity HflC (stomatin/prohibitin superfamily)
MASKTSTVPKPAQENPIVLIRYSPEDALSLLAKNMTTTLAKLNGVKIQNARQLESASEVLDEARVRSEEVETFLTTLRERVQEAAARFRDFEGFDDFEITLTVRKWSLRQILNDGIQKVRTARANFMADEQEKVRRENLAKQAEQDRINREAAAKAAAEAKKQGADKQNVAEIKQAVLETPAPVVTSRALENATSSVRYAYSAEITNLKSFLGACLNNSTLLATLNSAKPDIEKAFRSMAQSQKEAFGYPGITVVKKPVDVNR